MALTYYVSSNRTTSSTSGYYTVNYNYVGYGNSTYGWTDNKPKPKNNIEAKKLLSKERGW